MVSLCIALSHRGGTLQSKGKTNLQLKWQSEFRVRLRVLLPGRNVPQLIRKKKKLTSSATHCFIDAAKVGPAWYLSTQDIACDSLIRIAIKCKRQLIALQAERAFHRRDFSNTDKEYAGLESPASTYILRSLRAHDQRLLPDGIGETDSGAHVITKLGLEKTHF